MWPLRASQVKAVSCSPHNILFSHMKELSCAAGTVICPVSNDSYGAGCAALSCVLGLSALSCSLGAVRHCKVRGRHGWRVVLVLRWGSCRLFWDSWCESVLFSVGKGQFSALVKVMQLLICLQYWPVFTLFAVSLVIKINLLIHCINLTKGFLLGAFVGQITKEWVTRNKFLAHKLVD